MHDAPEGHTVPHPPQFIWSEAVSTHVPQYVPPPAHGGTVVVVVDAVVVVGRSSGAQMILPVLGVSVRVPNWSVHGTVGGGTFGHLSL
jgi:hypothetical protein